MRFVWAVAAFVLAAVMIGAGIAQRTVFAGPKSESQAIEVSGDAPYVLIDGDVLTSHDGSQTLRIQQAGKIFAAYARTPDVEAWLARSDYTRVSVEGSEVVSTAVPAAESSGDGAPEATPFGSDLWLEEFDEEGILVTPLQLPSDMSLLVASDGVSAAPQSLTLSWPVRNATPWAGPLIVGGSLVLLAGIVLYVLGVRHARRSRGPRRKGVPLPITEPIRVADIDSEQSDKGVISASSRRKQLPRGSRAFVVVPAMALSTALFAGCSADAWPELAESPTPSPTASVIVPEDQGSPVVTQPQAERIISRIADAVAQADAAHDATAAAQRLAGTALSTRETNYRLGAAHPDYPPLSAIPTGELSVILPEANDSWPRTFLAVAPGTSGALDVVMSVTQDDPWAPYKLTYVANLTSDAKLNLAPPYVGAIPILPDSPFLALAPDQLAAAYADVLDKGADSPFASQFDRADDVFIKQLDDNRAKRLADFNQTGAETGTMTFAAAAGATAPVALATLDSGAIVAVTVTDQDTVKPTTGDAVIKVDDNRVVQTLTGVNQSATGFTTTYANQLFFFVPSQSSKERIRLLGYSSQTLDAKVAD